LRSVHFHAQAGALEASACGRPRPVWRLAFCADEAALSFSRRESWISISYPESAKSNFPGGGAGPGGDVKALVGRLLPAEPQPRGLVQKAFSIGRTVGIRRVASWPRLSSTLENGSGVRDSS